MGEDRQHRRVDPGRQHPGERRHAGVEGPHQGIVEESPVAAAHAADEEPVDLGFVGDERDERIDRQPHGVADVERAGRGQVRDERPLGARGELDGKRFGDAVTAAELGVEHGLADSGLGGDVVDRHLGSGPADGLHRRVQQPHALGRTLRSRARRPAGAPNRGLRAFHLALGHRHQARTGSEPAARLSRGACGRRRCGPVASGGARVGYRALPGRRGGCRVCGAGARWHRTASRAAWSAEMAGTRSYRRVGAIIGVRTSGM